MKTHRQNAISDIICSKLNSLSTDTYHSTSKCLKIKIYDVKVNFESLNLQISVKKSHIIENFTPRREN